MLARLLPPASGDGEATPEPDGVPHDRHWLADGKLRVLVVEDEWLIAADLAECLETAGVEVLGPVTTVSDALLLVEAAAAEGGINAAVLDMNIGGAAVTPVADALAAIGVPFLYATGYPTKHGRGRHDGAPLLQKPFGRDALLRSVLTLGAVGREATTAAMMRGPSPAA